ncbi:MAG: NAD(P)H-hydrate dehydratase [Dehalococcoidia bacterium]|nr:NAD(P)H-hydrate dehydratase [Dehalococcoidia bacterium]
MKLVTSEEMRTIEQRAVDGGVSLEDLMQAAGLAVAQEAWLTLGVVAGRRILVLAGSGNNGGDGLVAARHLAEWEADVVVYLLAARGTDDPHLAAVRALGVPVFVATDDAGYVALERAVDDAELVVDALLGIGRSRPSAGALRAILARLQRARERPAPPRIVAVDVPTGVDADSGAAEPLAVRADITVTFGLAKVGLYTLPGSEHAGSIQVVDIGLPRDAERDVAVELLGTGWVRDRLPARPASSNKGSFGRVLVVAGSDAYVGAARLTAEACYRAGTGLVTLACGPRVQAAVAPALPEATYLLLPDDPAAAILDALRHADVLLIGPGLGQDAKTRALVADVLRGAPASLRACVVDADALNALAYDGVSPGEIAVPCVLTPHPGEMSRLMRSSVEAVQRDRLRTARVAAADWRQVVVLKGAHTVVAAPTGGAVISPHANPLLASAGTGDVLAGIVAGLVAQGAGPFDAAASAVYLHGAAAAELRDELGDRGLLASDLLPLIPRVIRIIREGRLTRSAPQLAAGPDALAAFGAPPFAPP